MDSWAGVIFFIVGDIEPVENLRDNRNWGGRPDEKRSMEIDNFQLLIIATNRFGFLLFRQKQLGKID